MPSARCIKRVLTLGGVLSALVGLACWSPSSPPQAPASVRHPSSAPTTGTPEAADDVPQKPLVGEALTDPVGALARRLQTVPRSCARVRSVRSRDEADAAASSIRSTTGLPVEVIEKDLGEKGIWYRVCVGNEQDAARLTAKATRWVAGGGILAPFLDPPKSADEARFVVLPLLSATERRPTPAQAKALLARSQDGLAFFAGPLDAAVVVATTTSGDRVVAVDAQGAVLHLASTPPPGCASCALAMQESPVVARRVLGVGDVSGGPDDEVLLEEETQSGTRVLSVLGVESAQLRRQGGVILARNTTDFVSRAEAIVVEADGDDRREIALTRLELRSLQGDLCTLSTHVELWGMHETEPGLHRVQPTIVDDDGSATLNVITAFDLGGDPAAASSLCADALRDQPRGSVGQLCLSRIRTLIAAGRTIDAVNAAGAIAERAPSVRAAVAGPLFAAMQALDGDPRLSTAPWECTSAPLVKGAATKSIDEVVSLARARLAERVSLSDVHDAVFVTASRDFGAESPVFSIAAQWLERLRITQPARHAAIDAALLPVGDSSQRPPAAAPTASTDGSPGFGGAP